MADRVLFVDDEGDVCEYYVTALKLAGFEVDYCDTTREGVTKIDDPQQGYTAIVLDLSMLHGSELSADETMGGLATGVVLYDRVRTRRPGTPVIVLTNVLQGPVIDRLPPQTMGAFQLVHKIETDPFEFAEVVSRMIRPESG
ncbi:MAG: hypothetical protein J0I06_05280 [Planctomycetes bacterium]|nr:hypothetical protein [Planctomycetota bacterium]